MENNEVALKAEIYDLSKNNQALNAILGEIGGILGLTGTDLTVDNIKDKLSELTTE